MNADLCLRLAAGLAFAAVTAFSCEGWGRACVGLILGKSRGEPPGEGLWGRALHAATGLGILAQAFFWLSLAGLFRAPAVVAALAAGCYLAWRSRKRGRTAGLSAGETCDSCDTRPKTRLIAWAWAGFWCVGPLALCLVPETAFDALQNHLWMTREMAATGWFPTDPDSFTTYYPNMAIPLFSAGFLFAGETGARLVHWLMGVLTAAALAGYWTKRVGRGGAALVAAAFLAVPLTAWEMSSAYVDLAMTLFVALAVAALFEWRSSGATGWLALSGLLFGFSLTAKYHPLLWVPFFAAAILCTAVARRETARAFLREALLFSLAALAPVAPWLVRNGVEAGNPLFPIPVPWASSPLITPEIVAEVRYQHGLMGKGRGLAAFASLPWNLAARPGAFRGGLWPIVFAAWPLPFLLRRRFGPVDRFFSAAFVYYLVAWFLSGQEIRYLLPAFPFVAWLAVRPLAAWGWGAAGQATPGTQAGTSPPVRRAVAALWGALIAGHFALSLPPLHRALFPDVAFQPSWTSAEGRVLAGDLTWPGYRALRSPFYAVYAWANAHLPARSRVLSFDGSAYWSRNPVLYTFSPKGLSIIDDHDPERVVASCRREGVTHAVVNMDWVTPDIDFSKLSIFFTRPFQDRWLREVFRRGEVRLFEIGPPPPREGGAR